MAPRSVRVGGMKNGGQLPEKQISLESAILVDGQTTVKQAV